MNTKFYLEITKSNLIMIFILMFTINSASAERIQNRWDIDGYLHIEDGEIRSGEIKPEWVSAQWKIEKTGEGDYFRLQNKWKPKQYLHIERGRIESGPINKDWWSAKWRMERTNDPEFVRLQNKWKPKQYLHIENGKLESGPIKKNWWSAQWTLSNKPMFENISTMSCSSNAQKAIDDAFNFIKTHGKELKYDFPIGKRKATKRRLRRRFDRKLDKMRISCAEKFLCREEAPRIALHAFGMAGRKIRLCYDKMLARDFKFCDLVEYTTHEYGHAIGLRKLRFGQHHKQRNDHVYQFGFYASKLCKAERAGNSNYKLKP